MAAVEGQLLRPQGDAGGGDAAGQRQQPGGLTRAGHPPEQQPGSQQQGAQAKPAAPLRQVGDRAGEHALVVAVGIEQAPVTADGSLADAFPRLVEGLDQVVLPAVLLGHVDETAHEARLVDPAGEGVFALAAFARPAGFADEDRLGRVKSFELLVYPLDLGQRVVDAGGVVFPIGQQVDGEEVYRRSHLRVAQPEFPDVGVGHRLADPRFHFFD
ncbi:hypothetical protein D3C78_789410 [compost metagenome]